MQTKSLPSPQDQACNGCSGKCALAYERTPLRVAAGLWAHFPPKGYVHKPAKCSASHIWESQYSITIEKSRALGSTEVKFNADV